MLFPYIFYAKIINYKHELDWPPGMFPQACGSWCFEVSGFVEPRAEEIISELAGLRKAIGTTNNFKVGPAVMLIARQIVFLTEFRRNVCVFDANVLRLGHWRLEVKFAALKQANLAPGRERTLLIMSLKSLRPAVGVLMLYSTTI